MRWTSAYRMDAMHLLAFMYLLFQVTQPCMAEEVAKGEPGQVHGAASAGETRTLSLGFTMLRNPKGHVWAHFCIRNHGKTAVLIRDWMDLSFSVSDADSKTNFLLHPRGTEDDDPMVYVLLDPPPPAPAQIGVGTFARRIRISPFHLGRLAGLRALEELHPETMKNAKLTARVQGSVLTWNARTGDFETVPFTISAKPESWKQYSHLFKGYRKTKNR